MRRLAAILLIVSFLALGAGALEHAHNLQHIHDDSLANLHSRIHDEHDGAHHADGAVPVPHKHGGDSPAECFLHALLHTPMLSTGYVPLLVCLGLFIAFLTLLTERPAAARLLARIDCRGPPAHLLA